MTEPPPTTVGPTDGTPIILPTRGHGLIKLAGADTGGLLAAFDLVFEPGEGPGEHVHSREHELWYVLDGEFDFLLGAELVHQSTGGLAFGPRGTPHTFQNVGTAPARLLVITAQAGLEDFFLEYDKRADGPYDMAALVAAAEVGGLDFIGPPLRLR
ncbi:MAG TPA: cupin domain-containing protein [Kutzneria sp.]|jgi:quercetin dioxygenase-like cupin family protein